MFKDGFSARLCLSIVFRVEYVDCRLYEVIFRCLLFTSVDARDLIINKYVSIKFRLCFTYLRLVTAVLLGKYYCMEHARWTLVGFKSCH